jgi:hypothetical protein
VEFGYEADEDELNREWMVVPPRWSQRARAGDASELHPLSDNENMEEEIAFCIKQEDYIGTKQTANVVYYF